MLAGTLTRPGVSRAFTETRTTYAGRSLVPDMIAFTWDRVPEDEHGEIPDDIWVPPDVAVEIRSPGQSLSEQVERCRWYVANGARASLLVDPLRRVVQVFRPDGESGPLAGDEVVVPGDVIPGCSFTVNDARRGRSGAPGLLYSHRQLKTRPVRRGSEQLRGGVRPTNPSNLISGSRPGR